jgi:FixJ family two-component response regulator
MFVLCWRVLALTKDRFVVGGSDAVRRMDLSAPTIHVVDDDASFRAAVARVLRASGYQVALYESGRQLLESPKAEPGCILLDLQMSGLSGLELQDRLVALGYMLPIVFLTGHGDIPSTVRAIKAGAQDFLSKPISKENLLGSLARALVRYTEVREQLDRMSDLRSRVVALTPRERQVFALVVRGRLNKQIAYALGTSVRTIKAHRRSIMQKLQVRSLAEAVSIAERLGMLDAATNESNAQNNMQRGMPSLRNPPDSPAR